MDIQTLARADLNLLVTLYVLYEERSVLRTAERLHLSQSAISKSLARARDLFGDALLIRSGHKHLPTPFLENMIPLLASTLDNADQMLHSGKFDPHTWRGEVKLAFPEIVDLSLMSRLLSYLHENAPGITLKISHSTENSLEQLANGDLDFTIDMAFKQYPEHYQTDRFLTGHFPLIIAREGHPLIGEEVTHAMASQYPRISVQVPNWERTTYYHTIHSKPEHVFQWESAYETDSLLSALSIVSGSNYLLGTFDILPSALMESNSLQFLPVKEYKGLAIEFQTIYHERIAGSTMHRWFRDLLALLGQEIFAENRQRPWSTEGALSDGNFALSPAGVDAETVKLTKEK